MSNFSIKSDFFGRFHKRSIHYLHQIILTLVSGVIHSCMVKITQLWRTVKKSTPVSSHSTNYQDYIQDTCIS